MGILDKKERILDTIVTVEGRRQIATGDKFKPAFVSFTDMHAFYINDNGDGIAPDATSRIYFEAVSKSEDSIIYEVSDKGKTLGFSPSENIHIGFEGGILVQSTGSNGTYIYSSVTGSTFSSHARGLSTGSIDNFKSQQLLGSVSSQDVFGRKYTFDLSEKKITFNITNYKPFGSQPIFHTANINSTKPLFFDERLGHLPNFKFLPPITKENKPYGSYTDHSGKKLQNFEDLLEVIGGLPIGEDLGISYDFFTEGSKSTNNSFDRIINSSRVNVVDNQNISNIEKKVIYFKNTNFSSNMLGQFFEIVNTEGKEKLKKLDIIDFGEYGNAYMPEWSKGSGECALPRIRRFESSCKQWGARIFSFYKII